MNPDTFEVYLYNEPDAGGTLVASATDLDGSDRAVELAVSSLIWGGQTLYPFVIAVGGGLDPAEVFGDGFVVD